MGTIIRWEQSCSQLWLLVQGLQKSGMGVILANPDQSKHLETATLRLHGLPIDLVHLRSESYTEDSRIPSIQVCLNLQADPVYNGSNSNTSARPGGRCPCVAGMHQPVSPKDG